MSACAAVEDACGVSVDSRVSALRRLLYCGEWIQSHALHIYLLHAPDFLGFADAVELAERDRGAVERGLSIKRTGNLVMETVGGRAIHPVNVKVGGFYRAPTVGEIAALAEPLRRARDAALATVEWVGGFEFPDVPGSYRFVALRGPGGTRSNPAVWHRPTGSTSARPSSPTGWSRTTWPGRRLSTPGSRPARLSHRPAGPVHAQLERASRGGAARLRRDAGLGPVCTNPFQSIVVRAVELAFACDEALGWSTGTSLPTPPPPRLGHGPEPAPVRPRPPVACSSTATSSMTPGGSDGPASCRPPRRTS